MPEQPTLIAPAAGGKASVGTAPVALLVDLNGNGVPDYKEPWFWRFVLNVGAWIATTFARPHTTAYKLASEYQTKVKPELTKPLSERLK